MADAARKAVQSALLDTWSRGPSLLPLLTNLGPVVRGGDSVDVPYIGSLTVATSESQAVSSTSVSVHTLTVNRPKFINQGLTMAQMAQLLNGNDAFAQQITRASSGQLANAIERDIVEAEAVVRDFAERRRDATVTIPPQTRSTAAKSFGDDAVFSAGMDPHEAGRRIVAGMGEDRGLIFTHPEFAEDFKAIYEESLAALPDEVAPPERLEVERMRREANRAALAGKSISINDLT